MFVFKQFWGKPLGVAFTYLEVGSKPSLSFNPGRNKIQGKGNPDWS